MQFAGNIDDPAEAAHPDAALAAFILALRSRGIRSKDLLVAFEKTPRAVFLPKANPSLLYAPYALPLDCGAEATAPHTVAQVLNALDLVPGMKVLEIGTGSGFQAAICARFGCHVVTIERFQTLHLAAARALKRLSIVNLRLEHGDGREGFAEGGPYDRIIVNGAVDEVSDALVEQLAPGGTIIVPIQTGRAQRLYAFDDAGENFSQRDFGRSSFQRLAEGKALAL
jgi:protein-L-isoaspartate(D-aspartate) O-methyltransferase